MTYPEFMASKAHQKAAAAYTAALGGRFVCEEPGDRLVYVDAEGTAYVGEGHWSAESGKLLSVLRESVDRQRPKDNLRRFWSKLEDEPLDPDILY